MDPLNHLLITRVVFGNKPNELVAGLAADIPFYSTYPFWLIQQGKLRESFQRNEWPNAPNWMYVLHSVAHSLPLSVGIAVLLRARAGMWPRWCFAWILHILIDIPTHSRKYWAPQFLWPCSKVTVDGVSWPILLGRLIQRVIPRP